MKQPPSVKPILVPEAVTSVGGEKRSNSRSTWNPRNKHINLKQQVLLTRTLRASQPPVWLQWKRLKAVQQFLTSFQFLRQSEAERQPKVTLPGLFISAWNL